MQFIKVFITIREAILKQLFSRQVVWALLVNALVDAEDGTFFNDNQSMATVRTFEDNGFVVVFAGNEDARADGTLELTFSPIVVIEVFMSGTTARAYCSDRNVSFGVLTESDRFNELTITFMEVLDEFFIIVLFLFDDDWWLVYFKFLILRRVGVIEGPLLERYIFADK